MFVFHAVIWFTDGYNLFTYKSTQQWSVTSFLNNDVDSTHQRLQGADVFELVPTEVKVR